MMLMLRRRRRLAAPELLAFDDGLGTDRRAFLRSGGYASGAALVMGIPAAGLLASDADAAAATPADGVPSADPVQPSPESPTMAYVHNAQDGIVVIMSGTTQRTVRDLELVRRLTVIPQPKPKPKAKAKPKPKTKKFVKKTHATSKKG